MLFEDPIVGVERPLGIVVATVRVGEVDVLVEHAVPVRVGSRGRRFDRGGLSAERARVIGAQHKCAIEELERFGRTGDDDEDNGEEWKIAM